METLQIVAMVLITIGLTSWFSAGIGHYSGYKSGYADGKAIASQQIKMVLNSVYGRLPKTDKDVNDGN